MLHAMAESWRGPFLDRARYFGDPDFVSVPVDALLDPARIATRAALFDPARARPSRDYDLPLPDRAAGPPAPVPPGTGTSHVCVVDAEGNIASVTTTINIPFGAGVSVAGFWLNDELDDFTIPPAPGNPAAQLPGSALNQAAPNRRPVSTMTPTIVFQGDDPVLVIGGSGGTRIVTSVEQAAWRAIVLRAPVAEAVAHPRIHQAAQPEGLSAEAATAEAVVAALRARGHQTDSLRYGAVVQAIRIARGADGGSVWIAKWVTPAWRTRSITSVTRPWMTLRSAAMTARMSWSPSQRRCSSVRSSTSEVGCPSRKMRCSRSMEIDARRTSAADWLVAACGRSTGICCDTMYFAVTMKMISSTRAMSTNGVTLMPPISSS